MIFFLNRLNFNLVCDHNQLYSEPTVFMVVNTPNLLLRQAY